MDIQAEKLHLIEWLARVNDIRIIQEIKAIKKEDPKDLFSRYSGDGPITRIIKPKLGTKKKRTLGAQLDAIN